MAILEKQNLDCGKEVGFWIGKKERGRSMVLKVGD
jgi:hypothetical protein